MEGPAHTLQNQQRAELLLLNPSPASATPTVSILVNSAAPASVVVSVDHDTNRRSVPGVDGSVGTVQRIPPDRITLPNQQTSRAAGSYGWNYLLLDRRPLDATDTQVRLDCGDDGLPAVFQPNRHPGW